ncbi:hypothetical protein AB0I28_32980 [Phytomonospora sp. NPDC050363]|uniref:hypothetical protein n=1 Tax=Phytomonospora sp. NPDC050363 TaxID=3155642 RepID=UPI0033E7A002
MNAPVTSVPPAWGRHAPGAGRALHVPEVPEFSNTTRHPLFPFVAGSGAPHVGVPIGRHMHNAETVGLDPLAWMDAGMVSNPGMFLLGQPGIGKSCLAKRLVVGMSAFGMQPLILGDTKPDYTRVIKHLGGQVIDVGRGRSRINPLDAGPLGAALRQMSGEAAERVRLEVHGRRLSLLMALLTLVRRAPISNHEEIVLSRAVDLLARRQGAGPDPTVPDVLRLLREGPHALREAIGTTNAETYARVTAELLPTLTLLCEGALKGIFDGPTTEPIDLAAPAVSIDISSLRTSGDQLVSAAMLSCWAYAFAVVDAAAVLAEQGLAPRRRFLAVMDELWRALRGAPGLVEYADSLTRLNRQLGMASLMITHSLDDLTALATEEDRAKARGFAERSAIKIVAALPERELRKVSEITRLSEAEIAFVSSWAGTAMTGRRAGIHPGRGKYLIKTGEGPGLPVSLQLVEDELWLYDTDAAIREER